MAWTTPGTAIAGQVLTASYWNTYIRDNTNNLRALTNVQQTVVTAAGTASASLAAAGTAAFPGLSVSITPTFSTSKVLVRAHVMASADGVYSVGFILTRGGTPITGAVGNAAGSRTSTSGQTNATTAELLASGELVYLDSPATTSATTYAITLVNSRSIAASLFYNRTVTDTDSAYFVRGMSSIVVQEIPV